MRCRVNDQAKIIEIWWSRSEQENSALAEQVKEACKPYFAKKYTVVYFHSGEQNLYDQTIALLSYNQKRSAQKASEHQQVS